LRFAQVVTTSTKNRLTTVALVALAVLVVTGGPASAQGWRGTARVIGVVQDLDDRPIVGATVVLRLADLPQDGPPQIVTDESGRWALSGLAPGRWEIVIEASGYMKSEGWIMIPESGLGSPVEVSLRSLREVGPRFSEGSPGTVRRWLEKGNELLDQGYYSEAREEFEKALRAMPEESRPEVLQVVARTYFLEGKTEQAVLVLEQALLIDPGDSTSRQLLLALLEGQGRRTEAEEFFDRLDREGPEAMKALDPELEEPEAIPSRPSLPAEITDPPVVEPTPGRLGRYRTSFTESGSSSSIEEFLERMGGKLKDVEALDSAGGRYELQKDTFYVYVPTGYRPEEPYGLLVWISPSPFGGFANPETQEFLDQHRLIWIGADNSGNRRLQWYRFALALDAVHNMLQLYEIDDRRIYVGGYSGGGRITSGLALHYPETFAGAFSIYGCAYFERMPVPYKPGTDWQPSFSPPSRNRLKRVRSVSRFVLLTGEWDFNRAQTKQTFEQMVADGFERVTYLQIPGASHYDPPGKEWWDKAIAALDEPLGPYAPTPSVLMNPPAAPATSAPPGHPAPSPAAPPEPRE
jgi:tetratricopeptide (TPR) repeat protein